MAEAVGRLPVLMRLPYGDITPALCRLLREARDLRRVMWSVDPEDWRRPSPDQYSRRICDQVHDGAIVPAHDIIASTIEAMPFTLVTLIERGFVFVTLSELLALQPLAAARGKSHDAARALHWQLRRASLG